MADETPPGSDDEQSPLAGALGALGTLGELAGDAAAAAADALGVGEEEDTTPVSEASSPAGSDEEDEEEASPPAPAAAVPAAAEKAPRKKRELAIPKNSAAWFKARRKFPDKFVFTAEGDLQIPEMRGQAPSVLKLPWYREATQEEKEIELERQGLELVSKEAEFDELIKQLKDAIAVWKDTGAVAPVLELQKQLRRLDAERTMLQHPLRWVHMIRGLTTRDIMPGQDIFTRSLHHGVAVTRLRELPYEKLIRVSTTNPRAQARGEEGEGLPLRARDQAPAAEVPEEEEEPEEAFIFFYDPADDDHGLFSPDTMVEFVFNETKYTSIRQAYEVERVTALGRKDARPLLLRTRAPKQVYARAQLIKGDVENPKELWTSILKAVVAQQPRYQEALRASGSDILVYANPADEKYGIGLGSENPDAMDKRKWKGPNVLGQVWMDIRASMPEEGKEEEGAGGAGGVKKGGGVTTNPMFTSHGISEKEAQERRGVLLARYKRPGQ